MWFDVLSVPCGHEDSTQSSDIDMGVFIHRVKCEGKPGQKFQGAQALKGQLEVKDGRRIKRAMPSPSSLPVVSSVVKLDHGQCGRRSGVSTNALNVCLCFSSY